MFTVMIDIIDVAILAFKNIRSLQKFPTLSLLETRVNIQ